MTVRRILWLRCGGGAVTQGAFGGVVWSVQGPGSQMQDRAVTQRRWSLVCVCVCVKTPRNTVKFSYSKQGAGEGGGGSPANEDTPPHPVQTYLHFRVSVE